MVREKRLLSRQNAPKMVEVLKVHEIDPDLLQNLRGVDGKEIDIFVGRGSFGVVRLQTYRRMSNKLPSTDAVESRIQSVNLLCTCYN